MGFATVAVWLSICVAHYRFRKQFLAESHTLSELKYRCPFYPFVPVAGAVMCIAVMIGMGIDPEQRIALYCGIPFTILCYIACHLTRKIRKDIQPEKETEAASPCENTVD